MCVHHRSRPFLFIPPAYRFLISNLFYLSFHSPDAAFSNPPTNHSDQYWMESVEYFHLWPAIDVLQCGLCQNDDDELELQAPTRATASTDIRAASARQTGTNAGRRRARTGPFALMAWRIIIAVAPRALQVIWDCWQGDSLTVIHSRASLIDQPDLASIDRGALPIGQTVTRVIRCRCHILLQILTLGDHWPESVHSTDLSSVLWVELIRL